MTHKKPQIAISMKNRNVCIFIQPLNYSNSKNELARATAITTPNQETYTQHQLCFSLCNFFETLLYQGVLYLSEDQDRQTPKSSYPWSHGFFQLLFCPRLNTQCLVSGFADIMHIWHYSLV